MTERAESILQHCIRTLKPGEIYREGVGDARRLRKDIASLKLLLIERNLTSQFEVIEIYSSVGLARLPRRRLDENFFPIE